MAAAQNDIHYFGIRHHGPGSCQRLLSELETLKPAKILIEGPSDCSEDIQWLAKHGMTPPVALLAYNAEQSGSSLYYPFAEFSPEYQACLFALQRKLDVAFIDLPVAIQLAKPEPQAEESALDDSEATLEKPAQELEAKSETEEPICSDNPLNESSEISKDPFSYLAELSGYEDGESWWNDFIEQNSDNQSLIFELIETIMTELRAQTEISDRDIQREAYMRLEIDKARKQTEGPIAVICGAWHVPALKEKHTLKANREILKSLPPKLTKSKVRSAWVPWTSPRLAVASGYGAGVKAPQWYQHLWRHRDNPQSLSLWLGKIAQTLREKGHIVSTASVIEAVRLYQALAVIRNKPNVGLEEVRDSVISSVCFGEELQWREIEQRLLLGNEVGSIPDDAPLIPLLEDLQKQQKALRLKPEALEKNLALDLRSSAGLTKSILLHRLTVLNVPWGKITDAGNSRGTFRERWILCWQPEFSVQLIENLVYGNTIELAANNKLIEAFNQENQLSQLANSVQLALEAQLNAAAEVGLKRIDEHATHTTDTLELLSSLSPLISIVRYGTARELSWHQIGELVERLMVQAAVSLPYSCRNLNQEEAIHYCRVINQAHQSILIAEFEQDLMSEWWNSLCDVMALDSADAQVRGLSARLLYVSEKIDADRLHILLQRMLSSSVEVSESAKFFEGFFDGVIDRLLFDTSLRKTVENWLIDLDEDVFVEFLPLFRRVFSQLDAMENRRFLDTVLNGKQNATRETTPDLSLTDSWTEHFTAVSKLIRRDTTWTQNQ